MTISSTTNRVNFNGNGVTTAFAVSFPFFATSDLVVKETVIATGAETTKALNTHYTVAGTLDADGKYPTGTVNYITAPASGVRVTIYRDPPRTQLTDFVDNEALRASTLEIMADRLVALVQRVADVVTRSLRQPDGDSDTISALPGAAARANKFLAFDADGNPVASSGTVGEVATTAFGESLVQADDAAEARTLLGVDAISGIRPGMMFEFGGTSVPTGYLGCDGSAVSRTTYADLFTAIGTTWGAGDGSTTFNLPDFRRRVGVGSGGSGTGTLGNAVGNTGGTETHTLTSTEMPVHGHAAGTLAAANESAHTHPVQYGTGSGSELRLVADSTFAGSAPSPLSSNAINGGSAHSHTVSGSTADAGSGGAHNNLQPSAVVLKIIKT